MTAQRRLAVATRGFRGTFGEKFYVNEAISLDEGLVNIDIIEVISVEVSSLDVEGAF